MIKGAIQRLLPHWFDWQTNRKFLVIESDDWGSHYLPSVDRIRILEREGILAPRRHAYLRLDCLERRADLEGLFSVLSRYTDIHGNPAKFTFNTVMGNPDFAKISECQFQEYHHQHFFESYREYNGEECQDLWSSAFNEGIMTPQFHAREHLNVPRWMRDLRDQRRDTLLAFENRFYCLIRSNTPPRNYLTAYWPDSTEDLAVIEHATAAGLQMFKETFGFASASFVACCYVLPEEVEACAAKQGVRLIQTQRRHRVPNVHTGESRIKTRIDGAVNRYGQVYSVRNVEFEPFEKSVGSVVGNALAQTAAAFRSRRPAIVSTHRVNYVSGMAPSHRDRSLRQLDDFLSAVTKQWPDVEFLGPDQLCDIMLNDKWSKR